MTKAASFPDAQPHGHYAALNDPGRLAALGATGLADSLPEEAFDRAVRLATRLTGTPVALFSLVDNQRQFFKAQIGLEKEVAERRETPLSHSFCQYVVSTDAALAVEDARNHPLLGKNLAVPDLDVIAYLGVPVHGPDGEPLGSICAINNVAHQWTETDKQALVDISKILETEITLRQAAIERELLLNELNHRIKNQYATIASIVRLSKHGHGSPDELAVAIEARVNALAKAHELIVPVVTASADVGTATSLKELLSTILAPHTGIENTRLVMDGPAVDLGPKSATNLSLALHELATNASKYGALSARHGELVISWQVEADHLLLDWRELLPTELAEQETKRGFGSQLIEICIANQLKGRIVSNRQPQGMHITIKIPMNQLRSEAAVA